MPTSEPVAGALDVVVRKLAQLARLAPDDLKDLEVLIDDALERHHQEARARRLQMVYRVK